MFDAERNRFAMTLGVFKLALLFAVAFSPRPASADIVPNYDFQWSTIGALGNAAYGGGPLGEFAGRGSVAYSYRMSTLEVTSSQWLEYRNII